MQHGSPVSFAYRASKDVAFTVVSTFEPSSRGTLVGAGTNTLCLESTESEMAEPGGVPILMWLPWMRNRRFHFDFHPDVAYLSITSGLRNVKFEKHQKARFSTDISHFEYGYNQKDEEALVVNDEWAMNEAKMELICLHK